MKRGRKRKAPPVSINSVEPEVSVTSEPVETSEEKSVPKEKLAPKGPKEPKEPKESVKPAKKAKKPVQEGCNSGVYNELEEKNFLEGLELFGRDWGKVYGFLYLNMGRRDFLYILII